MPSRALTIEEKNKNRINLKVRRFMNNVKKFIKSKNDNVVPPEWEAMLDMLEDSYKQYCTASIELEELDSYLVDSRYGPTINPLFKIKNSSLMNVQRLCNEFGLSMKQAQKMKTKMPKPEKSVLDQFFEGEIEKR